MERVFNVPLASSNFCHPSIQSKLAEFVQSSKRLSYSDITREYENAFAEWLGVKHCIAVNSGSSANLAILQSLLEDGRLSRGDCVGISAVTWSTNIMPIIQLGLTPIPIDVSVDDINLTIEAIYKALSKFQLKALFVTHLLGYCSSEFGAIVNTCSTKNIVLLEDTCESMGSIYGDKKLGTFGVASSFSTFVGHHFSTIEGGLICTDDNKLADIARSVISHGWHRHRKETLIDKKGSTFAARFYEKYTFYNLGFNLRPTEILSFAGLLSLPFLDMICQQRSANHQLFIDAMNSNYGASYQRVKYDHMTLCSNFAIPVILPSQTKLESFINLAEDFGVETRPLVAGNIINNPFADKWLDRDVLAWARASTPIATSIHYRSCYLPNRHNLSSDQIATISTLLSHFKANQP
jgi:CDP-6-deoxy-D-xylo-4-hexulose-3-dehydrase